jgi:hypothetical protein
MFIIIFIVGWFGGVEKEISEGNFSESSGVLNCITCVLIDRIMKVSFLFI